MSPSVLKASAVQQQTSNHSVRSSTVLLAFHWGWRIAALTSPATRCRRVATFSWRISIACKQ